jgi:hypothetical protein
MIERRNRRLIVANTLSFSFFKSWMTEGRNRGLADVNMFDLFGVGELKEEKKTIMKPKKKKDK